MTREQAEKEIRDNFNEVWADGIIKALEQQPFINKPCVSEKVCEHDKNVVLNKIRAEIQKLRGCSCSCSDGIIDDVEDILDKYKAESEG